MLRPTRILIAFAAVAGTAAIATSSATAATVPKGTLTSAEYQQLSAAIVALNKSASSKTISWTKARAACRKTGAATALLRTQRMSCLQSLTLFEALGKFPVEEQRCTATTTNTTTTTTTTTGTTTTTTTPAVSAAIQQLVCMSPRYQALGRDAKSAYRADIAARKEVVARGFTGSCLATLATRPADLNKERLFASSTQKLAADVTLLIKVTEGKAPTSDFNQSKITSDVRKFETSAAAVLAENSPQKLSSCAHQ